MTYDSADGYVLAVSLNATAGPANNTYGPTELTWKFAGGNWSLVTTVGQVPATLAPGLVYDANDGYTLLYGGRLMNTNASVAPVTNQTWSYLAGTWTNLSAANTPYSVDYANLVYDAHDHYVLLYDELGITPTNINGTFQTTWAYAAGSWTNLTVAKAAVPDFWGAMTYDAADGYVLYFGGYTFSDQLTNATWTFQSGTWSNITSTVHGAPSARIYSGITYDSSQHEVLLYGGLDHLYWYNASAFSYEMWGYAHGTWTLLSSNGPFYNTQSMVYDPGANATVVLGASNLSVAPPNVVTWTYSSGNWTVAAPAFGGVVQLADVGHPFTLVVSTPLNVGSLTYRYTGLPTGCDSVDAASVTCDPASAGSFAVEVYVTGAAGFRADARTTVKVTESPAVLALVPTEAVGEVGTEISFAVSATPGAGALTYAYTGLPPGCASANAPSLTCVPSGAGTYEVTASVTDAAGVSSSGIAVVPIMAALAVDAFAPERATIDVGQSVGLNASLGGGVGPFTFAYSGLPAGCPSVNSGTLSCRVGSVGSYGITLRANDILGALAHGSTSLRVNALPSLVSVATSSATIVAGGPEQLVATISGGTAPFQYRYAGLPLGCTASDAPLVDCSNVPAGNYTVSVTVIDATGASSSATGTFSSLTRPVATGPPQPSVDSGSFWWGLVLGTIAVVVVAVVGGYRLFLARQGEEIVQGLRTGAGESTEPPGKDPRMPREGSPPAR